VPTTSAGHYPFVTQQETGDEFKPYLQGILNQYHEHAYPRMSVPQSKSYVIRVHDPSGTVVGGAILLTYWGWL
jgi:hypothetical protein